MSVLFYLAMGHQFFVDMFQLEAYAAVGFKWISLAYLFLFWITVLLDIMLNKINDWIFWLLSMFFISFFAPVVYIFRRQKVLREPARY